VPKIKYRSLKKRECELLYEVWLSQQKDYKATRELLAEKLGVSKSVVSKVVSNLRNEISWRAYILSKTLRQSNDKQEALKKSSCYYILAEESIITKPETAAMLLQLRTFVRTGDRMVNRKSFIDRMVVKLNASEERITYLVERGIAKGYIKITDESNQFIVEAERTIYEEEYLKFIAGHFDLALGHK
jgi:hypothetical protein